MSRRRRLLAALFVGIAAGCTLRSDRPGQERPAVSFVDHHVHVLGPDVMRDWKGMGVTFSRADSIYTSADALLGPAGDSAARAVLVPMSHLYGTEDFEYGLRLDTAEERRRVERENDHVSREAARHPGRAVALCSAPALRAYAMDEFRRCRDSLNVAGLKIHAASSRIDLRNEAHLDTLAAIASWAEQARLPILLHLDPQRRGHDTTHIRRFAERVLGPHPDLAVVIAHLGGSGGYGAWTQSVFRTVGGWLRSVEPGGATQRQVYFDLSAVVLERESEGVPATTTAQVDALRSDLRDVGVDRLVFGSDHPVFDPVRGLRVLRDVVGLTDEEVAGIMRPANDIFSVARLSPRPGYSVAAPATAPRGSPGAVRPARTPQG